jgi:hypothetical protein
MPSYNANIPTERPDFVEPGDYEVEVVNAVETTSKGRHEMIELKLRTSAGSYLYDFLVFIPSAYWKIDAFRAATGEDVTAQQDVEITGDSLIGRTGTARLTVEEYNGKKRNKVAAWIIGDAKPSNQPQSAQYGNNPF